MSRKPALTPPELRARVRHLERHNRELADALRAARTALRQQQRHIAQLVRALDPIPTPRRRRVAA